MGTYIYIHIFQGELDATADIWNSHIIRPSTNERVPRGRPNIMYYLPELYDAQDYLSAASLDDINACRSNCTFRSSIPCDIDLFHMCNMIMGQRGFRLPTDAYQALDIYVALRREIKTLIGA